MHGAKVKIKNLAVVKILLGCTSKCCWDVHQKPFDNTFRYKLFPPSFLQTYEVCPRILETSLIRFVSVAACSSAQQRRMYVTAR